MTSLNWPNDLLSVSVDKWNWGQKSVGGPRPSMGCRTYGLLLAQKCDILLYIWVLYVLYCILQDKPALLLPWVICSIIIMIITIILYITAAVEFFRFDHSSEGASYIVGAIIYAREYHQNMLTSYWEQNSYFLPS